MKKDNLFDVGQEVVVITGASGKLGLNYVKTFLACEASVVAIDIVISKDLKSLNQKFKSKILCLKVDITNNIEITKSLTAIENVFGTPTVLVNNAAIDSPPDSNSNDNCAFENYPEESWDRVFKVNTKAVFTLCKVFGGAMKKNKKGSIINISSIYGVVSPDQGIYNYRRKKGEEFYKPIAYSASKSALINMTKYLAVYWAKDGIRVNTLVIAGVFDNQDQNFLKNYCERIPIGRMADETEYAASLIFLASSASSYMTGSEVVIDGGWTSI